MECMMYEDRLEGEWSALVERSPESTLGHDILWRRVLSRSLGHRSDYLLTVDAGRITGALPMFEIRHRVLGNKLVSVPVLDQAGILAENEEAEGTLYDMVRARLGEGRFKYAQIRNRVERERADQQTLKAVLMFDLPDDPQKLWNSFNCKVRNEVRKAEKSGLYALAGGKELVPDFYRVYSRNMRDLGVPSLPYTLFWETLDAFSDRASVVIVRQGSEPVGGGIMVFFKDTASVPWASSLRSHFKSCPNNLLYWKLMQSACQKGCRTFDFGRSTRDTGPYRFKKQWGAVPYALHWEYCAAEGSAAPDFTTDNPKYRLIVRAWRHLPVWIANTLGPKISGQVA